MTASDTPRPAEVATSIPLAQPEVVHDRQSAAAARAQPLPLGQKLSYAMGQMVEGAPFNCLTIFLMFYLTSVCGLPGALAGAALAAGLVVDAILDPVIGSVSDSLQSRLGRRVPLMLVGLPIIALAFVAIFSLPTGLPTMALFAWVTFLSITLRIALSLFILPYSAASAELTDDSASRSSVMAWRWSVGMIGMLIALILAFQGFLGGPTGLANRAGYTPFAVSVAALAIVAGLIASRTVYGNRGRAHPAAMGQGSLATRLLGEIKEVFGNFSFRLVFIGSLLFYVGSGTQAALGLHAYTYFWKLPSSAIQILTMSTVIGFLLGAPIAGPLLKRVENRTAMLIGLGGVTLCSAGLPLLRVAGLLPFEGSTLVTLLTINQIAACALLAVAGITVSAVMADVADEHEHLFGTRREGMFFAGVFFSSKAANGAGSFIAGLVLQIVAFPSAADAARAASVSPDKVLTFGLLFALIPGLFVGASVINQLFYRLSRARHREILADLNARRSALHAGTEAEGLSI